MLMCMVTRYPVSYYFQLHLSQSVSEERMAKKTMNLIMKSALRLGHDKDQMNWTWDLKNVSLIFSYSTKYKIFF